MSSLNSNCCPPLCTACKYPCATMGAINTRACTGLGQSHGLPSSFHDSHWWEGHYGKMSLNSMSSIIQAKMDRNPTLMKLICFHIQAKKQSVLTDLNYTFLILQISTLRIRVTHLFTNNNLFQFSVHDTNNTKVLLNPSLSSQTSKKSKFVPLNSE